jgi:hypothetical protein
MKTIAKWTAKHFDMHNGMIPATALVPCRGTSQLMVFQTGGCADVGKWMHGKFRGTGMFENLDEALATCGEASYLMKRADHYVVVHRGGLFDIL